MAKGGKSIDKLKENAQAEYNSIGAVNCPYLHAKVHFTSEGFNHLRYSKGRERTLAIQEAKLKLISKAKKLIEITTTVQEYTEGRELIHKKRYKKLSKEWSEVSYWGLKVLVKRVDEGKHIFWSVIPVWRTTNFQGIKVVNKSRGDLAED
jgi:hypothetical protein